MSEETKVRCPYCNGLYDQAAIEGHISGCGSNPDNQS